MDNTSTPRYAVMDGYPVIFTTRKALWNPGQGWRDVNVAEVYMSAKVLTPAEFKARFDLHDIPMAFFHD